MFEPSLNAKSYRRKLWRAMKRLQKLRSEMETCPICLVKHHESASITSVCGHTYGRECLEEYRESRIANGRDLSCPLCRTDLVTGIPRVYEEDADSVSSESSDNEWYWRAFDDERYHIPGVELMNVPGQDEPSSSVDFRYAQNADNEIVTVKNDELRRRIIDAILGRESLFGSNEPIYLADEWPPAENTEIHPFGTRGWKITYEPENEERPFQRGRLSIVPGDAVPGLSSEDEIEIKLGEAEGLLGIDTDVTGERRSLDALAAAGIDNQENQDLLELGNGDLSLLYLHTTST